MARIELVPGGKKVNGRYVPNDPEKKQPSQALRDLSISLAAKPEEPQDTPVRRYTSNEPSFADQAKNRFGPTEYDSKSIRREIEKSYRPILNSIDDSFDTILADERQAGVERAGRTRSLVSRAGLMGSPRGSSQRDKTTKANQQNIAGLEAEKRRQVAEVMSRIDERADNAIEARRLEAEGNLAAYQAFLEENRENVRDDLVTLAQNGVTLEELAPEDIQDFLEQGGFQSEFMLEQYLNANRLAGEQIDYQTKIEGNKVLAFGVNPTTGELVVKEHQLDFPVPSDYKTVFAPDGTLLGIPESGITSPEDVVVLGNYAKPVTASSSAGKNIFGFTPKQQFDSSRALASDFRSATTEARSASGQVQLMKQALERAREANQSGESLNAPSQAIVVTFNKILDPTSVVRESEFARVGEGQSLLTEIEGKIQKLQQGGAGITINELESIVDVGEDFLNGYAAQQAEEAQLIKRQAESVGLPIENILPGSVVSGLSDDDEEDFGGGSSLPTYQDPADAGVGESFQLPDGSRWIRNGEDDFEQVF